MALSHTAQLALDGAGVAHELEAARQRFELSGNPLWAWQAWQLARRARVPVPDWTSAYLDACAERLLAASASSDLPAALGIAVRPGYSAWNDLRTYRKRWALARRVQELLDQAFVRCQHRSVESAIQEAAGEAGMSVKLAEQAVREVRERNEAWLREACERYEAWLKAGPES